VNLHDDRDVPGWPDDLVALGPPISVQPCARQRSWRHAGVLAVRLADGDFEVGVSRVELPHPERDARESG
jgi:hypothetical protein